jgi:hypothetical protein
LRGTRALKEVTMDKNIIKETLLSLEGAALQRAREKYFDYVADARLDRREPIESDEQARPKSSVIFPKPWTIPSTITPISWTS